MFYLKFFLVFLNIRNFSEIDSSSPSVPGAVHQPSWHIVIRDKGIHLHLVTNGRARAFYLIP